MEVRTNKHGIPLEVEEGRKYSNRELTEIADAILHEDVDHEICRDCKEKIGKEQWEKIPHHQIPYGEETGKVKPVKQWGKNEDPILDDEGKQLVLMYPEYRCPHGHRWYKGEGVRRDTRGPNPILFEQALIDRKKREIYNSEGVPDPSIEAGIYNRIYPHGGRKTNTIEQRRSSGASFYR